MNIVQLIKAIMALAKDFEAAVSTPEFLKLRDDVLALIEAFGGIDHVQEMLRDANSEHVAVAGAELKAENPGKWGDGTILAMLLSLIKMATDPQVIAFIKMLIEIFSKVTPVPVTNPGTE